MNKIKIWTFALLFSASIGGSALMVAAPQTASAAAANNPACAMGILTFPVWYRGLVDDTTCAMKSPDQVGGLSSYIWKIVLNLLDIALQLVGYIAVGFIIYGGFMFMTAGGDSATVAKGRKTILNAVIGLAISIGSVAIVNLITGIIK